MNELKDHLENLRHEWGLTQEEAGAAAGLPKPHRVHWARVVKHGFGVSLERLAQCFSIFGYELHIEAKEVK